MRTFLLITLVAAALAAPVQILPGAMAPLANQTHYGDPANGCEADEQAVQVQGVAGKFCSPDCTSAACPTDVPAGVTAAPQCALKTSTGDKKCALICSPTDKWSDLRAGDAACGSGTCQPIQGTGLCTYGGGPAPPPSPPSTDCGIATGLKCAQSLSKCVAQCKTGVAACVECLGSDFGTCCPCIKKIDPKFPIQCPGNQIPEFMTIDVTVIKPTIHKDYWLKVAGLAAANQTHDGDQTPNADCGIAVGLQCGKAVARCFSDCKQGVKACAVCLGGDLETCCPCLEKLPVLKRLPPSLCGNSTQAAPFWAVKGPNDTCTGPHESCCPAPQGNVNNCPASARTSDCDAKKSCCCG